jgi:hypothetical protein
MASVAAAPIFPASVQFRQTLDLHGSSDHIGTLMVSIPPGARFERASRFWEGRPERG